MTTKDQERKALERIRKIVEELGEGSYICMAFEGCFEIAEENIDNDFGCSMKQRAESAEEKLEAAGIIRANLENEIEQLKKENEKLQKGRLSTRDAGAIKAYLEESRITAARMAKAAAEDIVDCADNPQDVAFKQAVQHHRSNQRKANEITKLIERLIDTMGA